MYLPLSPAIPSLLQVPFSPLDSELGALLPYEQQGARHNDTYDLGIVSPYHNAPNVPGVSVDLPHDCNVGQAILLHRHGSRGPVSETDYVLELVDTLHDARDIIQEADLPPDLQFLKQGYEYQLVPQDLTVVGRQELFDDGVDFSLRYPDLSTDIVLSSPIRRVVDSSFFFAEGLFGLETENITFLTVDDLDDPVSWITPWTSCPRYSDVPARKAASQWADSNALLVSQRLNRLIPGINLSVNDSLGALYACPFDLAARRESSWCGALTTDELRKLEYEYDLLMDGLTGHATDGDTGPLLGAFYIKQLIERLTNATGDAAPLYLEFGHDTSILLPLSTMGLNKDSVPLNPLHMPADRRFRTSQQAPFAANMVWEKFTCKESFDGPQVRLVLNRATFPLSICQKSEMDKKYGTCSLDEFVKANKYSAGIDYQNEEWNSICEFRD